MFLTSSSGEWGGAWCSSNTHNAIWKLQLSLLRTTSHEQQWAYTKSSCFKNVSSLHLGNTNRNSSSSMLISSPSLWMCTISGWWNIPLGSTSSQGTSWPVSPSSYCRRRSSLFCSHSPSLWACLYKKLSLWLHSWQGVWRTCYYTPWDSSATLLHKFNLELHM